MKTSPSVVRILHEEQRLAVAVLAEVLDNLPRLWRLQKIGEPLGLRPVDVGVLLGTDRDDAVLVGEERVALAEDFQVQPLPLSEERATVAQGISRFWSAMRSTHHRHMHGADEVQLAQPVVWRLLHGKAAA